MSAPELAPRRTFGGVVAVWVVAALGAVVIGVFAPLDTRAAWITVALGACLILSFAVQLASGRAQGFTQRVAMSVLGALLVMGFIGLGFALASIVAL